VKKDILRYLKEFMKSLMRGYHHQNFYQGIIIIFQISVLSPGLLDTLGMI